MKTTKNAFSARRLWIVRSTVFILAIAGVGFGVMRGEQAEVLKKAVGICLQCIGIG